MNLIRPEWRENKDTCGLITANALKNLKIKIFLISEGMEL